MERLLVDKQASKLHSSQILLIRAEIFQSEDGYLAEGLVRSLTCQSRLLALDQQQANIPILETMHAKQGIIS